MAERRLAYRLSFRSSVGIYTGLGVAGLVDRLVVRGPDGVPAIPGSSVKGRLRFAADRILRSGAVPAPAWRHPAEGSECKEVVRACTLCRLFGNPAVPGLVRFGAAAPDESLKVLFQALLDADRNPVVHADAELRPGVAISRRRRTAFADHLFFDEAVPATVTFRGALWLDERVTSDEETFLGAAGRSVDALGARKAAGRGALEGGVRIGAEAA